MNMQEFRFALEHQQREQQIVVDLMPQQYAKPSTPPPSPPMKGQWFFIFPNFLVFFSV